MSVFLPLSPSIEPTKLEHDSTIPDEGAKHLHLVTACPLSTTMPPIPAGSQVRASGAFASFAGSSSAFSLAPSIMPSTSDKPVWASRGPNEDLYISGTSSESPQICRDDTNAPSTDPPAANSGPGKDELDTRVGGSLGSTGKSEDPLAAHTYSRATHTAITGEEDEQVTTELKGVKVFIKRGDRDFSDGILGHARLLSHKITGAERLLFRREHVWKVSMSVRLRPAVRCSFDEEQGILRVALKESEECEDVPPEQRKQQVVVYALKRGKVSKADFVTFARAVMASSQLGVSPIPVGATI